MNQHKFVERMTLGDMKLKWVNSFKYLGHSTFNSGRFLHFDSRCVARKSYGSFNSILGQCKYADKCVKLCLVKSFCVSLLTYCIGVIDASDQVKDLAVVCWNDSFRLIFGYKR